MESTSKLESMSRCARLVWWGALVMIFLAPLPLGSNRPWAWGVLTSAEFLLVGIYWAMCRRGEGFGLAGQRKLTVMLALWITVPILQLIPIPLSVLELISPGSAKVWASASGAQYAIISLDPNLTIDIGLRQAATVLFSLMLFIYFRDKRNRSVFVYLIVLVGIVNAIIGFVDFGWDGIIRLFRPATYGAVSGTYVNKNDFAGLMELTIPFAALIVAQRLVIIRTAVDTPYSDGRFLLALLVLITLVSALLLSVSRGGVLASLSSLLFCVVIFSKNRRVVARRLVWFALFMMIVAMFLQLTAGFHKVWHIYAERGFDLGRIVYWKSVLPEALHYWLLGGGVGAYDSMFAIVKPPILGLARFNHAHNDYLEFLATMGWYGLALFVLSVGYVLKRAYHLAKAMPASGCFWDIFMSFWAVCAMLVHSMVDFNLQIPANFLIFFCALMYLHAVSQSGQSSSSVRDRNSDLVIG